jgi:hypothetical protein
MHDEANKWTFFVHFHVPFIYFSRGKCLSNYVAFNLFQFGCVVSFWGWSVARCILRRRKCFMFHLMWIFACFVYTNLILQSPVERFKENR